MQCEYCQGTIQNAGTCPNCGTTRYTAAGKIIYGATVKDASGCEVTITEKYLLIRKVSGAESKGKRLSVGFGLLGVLAAEAITTKVRPHGFYALSQIEKAIFPYLTNGIKKKNAIKLINKDGSDFILIFDKPGLVDGTAKVLKKMVENIRASVPLMEDGTNVNYGNLYCAKPFVNADNFDQIKPGYKPSLTTNTYSSAQAPTPAPQSAPKTTPTPTPQSAPKTTTAPKAVQYTAAQSAPAPVHTPPVQTPPVQTQPVQTPKASQSGFQSTPVSNASVAANPAVQNNSNVQTSADIIHCSVCGNRVSAGNRFCGNCGAKLEITVQRIRKCIRCGEVLKDGDRFCGHCGYPVK